MLIFRQRPLLIFLDNPRSGGTLESRAPARTSTADRDRKFKELDSWVSDLRGVCEVAFYDDRDELEKLGPLAPTRRRRSSARKQAVAAV